MIIVSLRFPQKKWLQTIIVARKKMMWLLRLSLFCEKINFIDYRYKYCRFTLEPWKNVPSTAIYPFYSLCPYTTFAPSLWPSVPSTALCLLYGPLSPLRSSAPSMALFFPLYNPLFLLFSPLSPLRPHVPSTATYFFYSPLSPLQPFAPSIALCPPL